MKAIVTGGAGFIGSALVKKLIDELKYEVLVIDCLNYASQINSLDEIKDKGLYSFSQSNIADKSKIEELVKDFKPKYIFNLAAETHVDRSIDSPEPFLKTNILGTFSLLEASLAYWRNLEGVDKKNFRFLHVSTDEVFGDLNLEDPPFTEQHNYCPSSPYSASKAGSDHLVRAWHRTYNLPVLVTNCSNNFGPYQFYEKLIPHMILRASRGDELPIYGSGLQVRDWLYVYDHIEAIIKVIANGRIGESYNIGGNSERTNLQVVHEICKILNELISDKPHGIESFHQLITHVEDRPGHDTRYAIDASKLNNELQWYPTETFETGLRKTIMWYLNNDLSKTYETKRVGLE